MAQTAASQRKGLHSAALGQKHLSERNILEDRFIFNDDRQTGDVVNEVLKREFGHF